jgi:crotonobetainyl-CoA:carnitine CoA-transferase CaiB-like acyl-CoA transferase
MAGLHAAVGVLIAHYYRELTGEGQHVDISMREAFMSTLLNINAFWWVNKVIVRREGMNEVAQLTGGTRLLKRRLLFRCRDGQVSHVLETGQLANREIALVNWMDTEGMAGNLKGIDFRTDLDEVTQEQLDSWLDTTERFFLTHTKAELYREAGKRGLFIYPVCTAKDILENEQLKARDFWVEVEHPELDASLTYPGPPFKSTEQMWRISRRAPLIGEHNLEIYENEFGFSREELCTLSQHNVI